MVIGETRRKHNKNEPTFEQMRSFRPDSFAPQRQALWRKERETSELS